MIDLRASVARLIGVTIDEPMAQDIVGLIAERDRLAAENERLRAAIEWNVPAGLVSRPPGRDR